MTSVRVLARRARILAYGVKMKLQGSALEMPDAVRVHLDPFDARAQSIHRRGGEHDGAALRAWKDILVERRPTVVIDIGANYGIFGLSAIDARQVHLIEPNPAILSYLARTVEPLPNVSLHPSAASDHEGTAILHLQRNRFGLKWSGSSSLDRPTHNGVQVSLSRVDDLVRVLPTDRLVFKIDIEGHEVKALQGMAGILACARDWVGLVETADPSTLEAFGRVCQMTAKDYTIRPATLVIDQSTDSGPLS